MGCRRASDVIACGMRAIAHVRPRLQSWPATMMKVVVDKHARKKSFRRGVGVQTLFTVWSEFVRIYEMHWNRSAVKRRE